MTAVDTPPPAATAPPARPGRWRRHRTSLLIVAFLVLAVVVVLITGTEPTKQSATYDPDNPGPDGAQAVARVLDDQGVDVTVVRSADALDEAELPEGTTVLVTSSNELGASTVDRLQARARGARLVVVDPGSALLDELGVGGFPERIGAGDPLAADCEDARFADLEIEVDDAAAMPLDGCFGDALVTQGDLTLLGAGQALTNDQVLRADNAAMALRLLGAEDRLVWYVASFDDLVGDDGVSVRSLLPDWIGPGLWLLLLATLLLVVWRGRRLGPLATEPLPVVVKAIETTRSRGRLYRRAGDRGHAAATLRAAARGRLNAQLGLGPTADEDSLIRDVARRAARSPHDVASLLRATALAPGTDRDLIRLANDLAALDREVRRR